MYFLLKIRQSRKSLVWNLIGTALRGAIFVCAAQLIPRFQHTNRLYPKSSRIKIITDFQNMLAIKSPISIPSAMQNRANPQRRLICCSPIIILIISYALNSRMPPESLHKHTTFVQFKDYLSGILHSFPV